MTPAQQLHMLLSIMNSKSWSREDAHALLDAALDLADDANDAEGEAGRLAQAAALTLSRAVAGWTVSIERTPAEWDRMSKEDPASWREEVIERMRATYSVLPQPVVDTLMFALSELQRGKQPEVLEPISDTQARRVSRYALEQAMLVWIAIENARGRRVLEVRKEVALAVGMSARAIEEWAQQWRVRDGEDRVEAVLRDARAWARGENVTSFPNEVLLIRLIMDKNGRPLRALADSWRAQKS